MYGIVRAHLSSIYIFFFVTSNMLPLQTYTDHSRSEQLYFVKMGWEEFSRYAGHLVTIVLSYSLFSWHNKYSLSSKLKIKYENNEQDLK